MSNHPYNTAHSSDSSVAIIIKPTLSFSPLPNFTHDYLQFFAVPIKLNNIPNTITSIYCPPRHNISTPQFNNYLSTINFNFIISGYINAKHLSWEFYATNPRGNVLYNFSNAKKYTVFSPPGLTYWPYSIRKIPDILNIFLS